MVKSYLTQIIDEILYADNNELRFLKWFIIYEYKGYFENVFEKEMLCSLQNCNLISGKNIPLLTDDKCADIISGYVTNQISKDIQSHNATDYAILLYIYVSSDIFSPATPTFMLKGRNFNFSEMIETLRPLPVPKGMDIKNRYNEMDYLIRKLHFADKVVLFLYLLFADISVLSQYNLKIKKIEKDNDTICVKNLEEIIKKCKGFPSRYSYFFTKKISSTHKKIDDILKKYLEDFPEAAIPFAPSFVTVIFNSMKPNTIKKMDKSHYEIFSYDELAFPLNGETPLLSDFQSKLWNESIFLKMIVLPAVWRYTNEAQDIENRFGKELKTALDKWKKANSLQDRDFTEGSEIDKTEFFLHALVEHDFCFSNSYFNIFLYICENQELFVSKKGNFVDTALSILHLNTVTKWYDALLLMQGMPLSFRKFKLFYLKMLSVYLDFQEAIYMASDIPETFWDMDMKQDKILLSDIKKLFWEKSSAKLGGEKLLQIFKSEDPDDYEKIFTSGINPICQWILLLENDFEMTEEELEDFSAYYQRLVKRCSYRDHESIVRDGKSTNRNYQNMPNVCAFEFTIDC